ncbi:MAG: hypothetical protein CVV42_16845 [Candidatus Riflebacteria bacterium HGW-Riflebacteria-2]|nr:MAG: hypothetical protein CVV42_16845 [Candidatus Riflebacteria bacterium HGW-Riflebacteria-2]
MQKKFRLLALTALISGLFNSGVMAANPPAADGTHYFSAQAKGMKAPAWQRSSKRLQTARNTLGETERLLRTKVGDKESFSTFNFATNKWEQTEASLVATSDNFMIYLEEGNLRCREIDITRLLKELEDNIYPTTTRYFGRENRPGIDNEERITILLMDIKDNAAQGKTYTSGYFNRGDCYRPDEIPAGSDLKSNQREMLYIDTNPSEVNTPEFFATIAHELQHLIHFHYDADEYDWVDEGCAQINTWFCGYGHPRQISAFQQTPDNSLVAWSVWNQVANYGQTYLWNLYLVNRFLKTDEARQKFYNSLVSSKKAGIDGFNSALSQFKTNFSDAFDNFYITSFLNQPELKPAAYTYGQLLPDYSLPVSGYYTSFPTTIRDSVSLWGADMYKLNLAGAGSTIRVDFAGDLTTLDNQFEVILLFVNEVDKKVTARHRIANIKATTPRRNGIARVMLPGHNNGDYDYPAPPVRTQMGHIEVVVPPNAGMMYLMVVGKAPANVPDSMLAWSAKSTYRLDIKTIENATALRAAANAEFNSKLLKQYESLSADSSAKSVDYLEALHKQILSDVNSAFANGNSRLAQEYISEIDASVNANLLSALKRDLLAQKNFNQLQQ